jgi:hypothetical protein
MKNLLILLFLVIISVTLNAQLKTTPICNPFEVDILSGRVNGVPPDFTINQIKEKLPCATSTEPEDATSKCGGGVFYSDKDIYFYTGRDYVEIKEKFKGKLSIPLMGASRTALFKWLGHPKIKDVNWDAFQTAYGILILYYNKANKINRILFSKKTAATLTLCE